MRLLRPTSQSVLPTPSPASSSTESSLGVRLRRPLSMPTSSTETFQPPSTRLRGPSSRVRRVLDFDVECVAAGFADPAWVPVRITAWAYSWIGEEGGVEVEALSIPEFYDKQARREFLAPLLEEIRKADVLTGHNIVRADLRWLNAECMNLLLPTLPSVLVQDTIRLPRSSGFKKGQDNMSFTLGVKATKLPLSWAEWEAAYSEPGLVTVKDRVVGDVVQHMELRDRMRDAGWLQPPRMWKP